MPILTYVPRFFSENRPLSFPVAQGITRITVQKRLPLVQKAFFSALPPSDRVRLPRFSIEMVGDYFDKFHCESDVFLSETTLN